MEAPDTFHLVPLTIDPSSKALSTSDPSLEDEIAELNKLHRAFLSLDTPNQVPAPPAPVNPKRSIQISKLRESGNASWKKGAFADAVKMYDLALRMAADRPGWEAAGLVREELSALYSNRSQAYLSQQMWAEGSVDAQTSVELKKVGNAKAWRRRAIALREMGLVEEARQCVRSALEFERAGPDKQGVAELESLAKSWSEEKQLV